MLQINTEELFRGIKTIGLFGYLYLIGLAANFMQSGEIDLVFILLFCLCGILFSYFYIKYIAMIPNRKLSLLVSVLPWVILMYIVLM